MNAATVRDRVPAAGALGVATLALTLLGSGALGVLHGDQARAAAAIGVAVRAPGPVGVPAGVYDRVADGACSLSADGALWYRRPAGLGPPVVAAFAACDRATELRSDEDPPVPAWAQRRSDRPTDAIFVATSLQEAFSLPGMVALHEVAHAEHVPMTWMVASWPWVDDARALHDAFHAHDGDDVQTAAGISPRERAIVPWFAPAVAVEGAGHERAIDRLAQNGFRAFWGIAWNSYGTDRNADLGAPWGAYCADPHSYKHPSPTGSCALVGFEWTARDLTRAYLSEDEAAFSTDPDDLRLRGGFGVEEAQSYVRALTDAYAAAGESQPLVMMSQQESSEEAFDDRTGDRAILQALYHQAREDGMHVMTLAQAARAARAFAGRPRAIAFPYIAGGRESKWLDCDVLPATIDYHDARIALSFVAGQTLPSRAFRYDPREPSRFDAPVSRIAAASYPELLGARGRPGGMTLRFRSASPQHFGIALWSDPAAIGLAPAPNVVKAGRAGAVVVFDLPAGESTQFVHCSRCDPRRLPLAI